MQKQTIVSVVAVMCSIAFSAWSWRELAVERLQAEALQKRMLQLERQLLAPRETPGSATSPLSPIGTPAKTLASHVNGMPTHPNAEFENEKLRLLQDPQYRTAIRALRRQELAKGHIDLASAMGISPDLADKLINLLVEGELRSVENSAPMQETEDEALQWRNRNEAMRLAQDADLLDLLGEAKFAKWELYRDSLSTRHQVSQLRSQLSLSDQPLREDQIEPLVSAMYQEQKQVRNAMADFTASLHWADGMETQSHLKRNEKYAELADAANQRILTSAELVLSAKQLSALEEILRRERDMQDAQYRLQRAMSNLTGQG